MCFEFEALYWAKLAEEEKQKREAEKATGEAGGNKTARAAGIRGRPAASLNFIQRPSIAKPRASGVLFFHPVFARVRPMG